MGVSRIAVGAVDMKDARQMQFDDRLTRLIGLELPIIQAPMAGSNDAALVVAVSEAGGLGSLPCATASLEEMRRQFGIIKQQTARPVNANFFCHAEPEDDAASDARWMTRLAPHFAETGADVASVPKASRYYRFGREHLPLLAEFRPKVVSFHFGLPDEALVREVKALGALVMSSATTVAEAKWLAARGCDVIIAQGAEAGGHRGVFLTEDPCAAAARQPGTFALVPQVVDAVEVPVIAAGGIADGRGVAAAFVLGASGVQVGTAYLATPEARTSAVHRAAIQSGRDDETVMTNVLTGRPARGFVNRVMADLGPLSTDAPPFPLASRAIGVLRAKAEPEGKGDYSSLWAGQAVGLVRERPAAALTRALIDDGRACLDRLRRP
jgi:nitronate monooxygenase